MHTIVHLVRLKGRCIQFQKAILMIVSTNIYKCENFKIFQNKKDLFENKICKQTLILNERFQFSSVYLSVLNVSIHHLCWEFLKPFCVWTKIFIFESFIFLLGFTRTNKGFQWNQKFKCLNCLTCLNLVWCLLYEEHKYK